MLLLEAISTMNSPAPSKETEEGDDDAGSSSSSHHHKRTMMLEDRTASSSLLIPGLPDDIALTCLALARRSDHPSLACLNSRFNSLIGSGLLYDLRRRMGVAEHWVYLVCDPRGWEAFDPAAGRWMRLPRIPCDDCFNHADKESLAVGPQLLVFGRELWDFAVWAYQGPRRGGWARCRPMNLPRCLFGSGSSGPTAIVAGGSDKAGKVLRSAEMYDSRTGRWERLPDMHLPRKLCSGFFMGGRFYVIGGLSGPNTPALTCGEEYDPQGRRWRRIEGMLPAGGKAAGGAPPLVAVVGERLYAVERESNTVRRYEGEAGKRWVAVGRLPVRADTSNGWGLAFKACGEELLVVGGQRGPEGDPSIVLSSWRPPATSSSGEDDDPPPEWRILGAKEHAGVFVYNCAVMGC